MGDASTKLLEIYVAIGNVESRCLERVQGKYLGGFQRMRQILVQRLLAYKDDGIGSIVAGETNTGGASWWSRAWDGDLHWESQSTQDLIDDVVIVILGDHWNSWVRRSACGLDLFEHGGWGSWLHNG